MLRHSRRWSFWSMYPTDVLPEETVFPFRVMEPHSGSIRPAIRLRRVDFPQPEGPTMDRNSPGIRSKDI